MFYQTITNYACFLEVPKNKDLCLGYLKDVEVLLIHQKLHGL